MLDSSWRSLHSVVNSLTLAAAAAQRVLSMMDALPKVDLDAGIVLPSKLVRPPSMELVNVSFRYPTRPENKVLEGVSFKVAAGKVTALVGPSGGGKSTCVALLLRMYDPEAGTVLLDGVDLKTINPRSFHNHVGVVSQDTQCFATSVLANITYGMDRSSYDSERVVEAAKRANIHEEILGFEEGYATKIGERGVRLSGGQRQRLALARVFLRRPALLLLDEATSALDAQNEALVQRSIDGLLRDVESSGGGATAVVVAHRLSTVVAASAIHVIEKGKLIESGTHDELLALGGKYAALVHTQLVNNKATKEADPEATSDGENGLSDEYIDDGD
jgi:ABC-type multidrug transport system fused ATPase/permease subunit